MVVVQLYVVPCSGGGEEGRSGVDALYLGRCWKREEMLETNFGSDEKAGLDLVDGE